MAAFTAGLACFQLSASAPARSAVTIGARSAVTTGAQSAVTPIAQSPAPLGERISEAARARTHHRVVYDPAYVSLAYPGGDVPPDRGVCADVIVRALRGVELDLQVLIHEDMRAAFAAYPRIWGLQRPDRNIDHRRVPNIETFLTRIGARLAASAAPVDYQAGDIVAWNLRGDAGSLPHIGIVTDRIGASGWPMVVHNIGEGPREEDVLFSWPMTGHYRLTSDIAVARAQSRAPAR